MTHALRTALSQGRAVKIISGLHNFDPAQVTRVVRAADQGRATFVDIACSPELVKLAKSLTELPICVSAVEPVALADAVQQGADLAEIGNFDSFYPTGRTFGAEEVLALTIATRKLIPARTLLSVTVPHILALDEQAALAMKLVAAGADIIQTEGGTSSRPVSAGTLGLIEKAAPTLAAVYEISRAVSVPVLCASGLSTATIPMALAAGAAGVGIGSAVNKLTDELAMTVTVCALVEAVEMFYCPMAQPIL